MAAPRGAEQLLIEQIAELHGQRVLCTSLGRAQLAAALAGQDPRRRVVCFFLDLYLAQRAAEQCGAGLVTVKPQPAAQGSNLSIVCQADLPGDEIDLAALPFHAQGEAELTREILQQAHQALRIGGRLYAATDNPRDIWLAQELGKLFANVQRRAAPQGAIYAAVKTAPLAKLKDFTCELVFRDGPHLVRAVSRPGVFAHRRVDAGARAILRTMEVGPGQRVCDMGCGSGVLALAAAMRAEGVSVHALDSNPRAIECLGRGAALNGLGSITAELDAAGNCPAESFDLFLANPPYYSDFRIAEVFVRAALGGLRRGGRMLLVTKSPDWYAEHLPERFAEVEIRRDRDYTIVAATR